MGASTRQVKYRLLKRYFNGNECKVMNKSNEKIKHLLHNLILKNQPNQFPSDRFGWI